MGLTLYSDLDCPCDEVFPPGTWGYHYRYVCIIYVGTVPSTNIFTMNIIPKDGTGFNGNVFIQGYHHPTYQKNF